jgi:hypothetical protein
MVLSLIWVCARCHRLLPAIFFMEAPTDSLVIFRFLGAFVLVWWNSCSFVSSVFVSVPVFVLVFVRFF